MELLSQEVKISKEPEIKGFDLSAGNTWIYPENYPIREYQYNIVKASLYNNTLVCLPTGLGKTFIAAVVMYNFWRWYPYSKIIFLAPTKPLVAQQINACYEVMGIPSVDMIELTGNTNQKKREIAWLKKKIIFATPQVFHNDLEKSIVPSHLIKCVVVDEAHKALRKHSYCECIRILSMQNQYFRVLALSATPGNKIDNVHEVIQNLHISHMELRDESSKDIIPYINKRKIDTILVPLSNELATFKEKYINIMDRHVRILIQYNLLRSQTANISKGRIFHLLKDFQTKTNRSESYNQILKTLNILLTMYHAYELMIRHGLRAFFKFYQNHSDKYWMQNENQLHNLLHDVEIYLGPFPEVYPNGEISEITTKLVFGHNKFHKLKELLERHFSSNNGVEKDTRAIVFVEYRDIVNEVYVLLLQLKPIIRPQMFVGQAGQKQKQQQKALEDFRNNRVNVLISTSIGEEGLDVGEVDLIICFDVSQHSPIRLVQRMGRTGRKRDGHIIILVTDGKEHENLKSTLSRRDSLNNKILNTSNIFSSLYQNNPRMIPKQLSPECHKRHIKALPKTPNEDRKKKKKKDVKKKNELVTKQKNNLFVATQKSAGQSSMTKFFINNKHTEPNAINPRKVILLSDDNTGIEFLTLCAVKKSQEEMSSKTVYKMDTTYIPTPKPVTNFLNFAVPNIETFDCLSFLSVKYNGLTPKQQHKSQENEIAQNEIAQNEIAQNEIAQNEIAQNENDYFNNDDDNFWYTIRNQKDIDKNEVRFEDLLDDSFDSSITSLHVSQRTTNVEINAFNESKVLASNMKDNDGIATDRSKTELSNDIFDNNELSIFENIFNDSFSSIDDAADENAAPNASTSFSNIVENTERFDITHKSVFKASPDKVNTDRSNKNLSVPGELAKLSQTNKFAENFTNEIQDLDFSDDMSEYACETTKNKSIRNSKLEESYLSITQAIKEIKTKRDFEKSTKSSVNENESLDDNSGWISMGKHEIKVDKSNTCSIKKIQLSNLSRNSMAKLHTIKQDFFQDNSDEDFMLTADNTKKFDELESSYFCSKRNSKNDNGETSKSVQLCKPSTSVDNRRRGLSLQKNKQQSSNAIDLSIFEAPRSKITQKDRDLLMSDVSTSKRMPSSNSKVVYKIRHDNKRNEFIDDEVEVDFDVSSDESFVTMDEDLDFVSYTQNVTDQVDMQAHYLKTIKSPMNKPGAFYFKKPKLYDSDIEIYSQPRSQEEDSYLNDSFCVSEADEPSALLHNDTIMERAKRQVKLKKRKHPGSNEDNKKQVDKRKRIILNNSVSSEDEVELLRLELQKDKFDDD